MRCLWKNLFIKSCNKFTGKHPCRRIISEKAKQSWGLFLNCFFFVEWKIARATMNKKLAKEKVSAMLTAKDVLYHCCLNFILFKIGFNSNL